MAHSKLRQYRAKLRGNSARTQYENIMRNEGLPIPVEAQLLPATRKQRVNVLPLKKNGQQKMTIEVKEVIARCFYDIGGRPAFAEWARNNKTDFYKLYSKLLPIQLQSKETKELIITISPDEANL